MSLLPKMQIKPEFHSDKKAIVESPEILQTGLDRSIIQAQLYYGSALAILENKRGTR